MKNIFFTSLLACFFSNAILAEVSQNSMEQPLVNQQKSSRWNEVLFAPPEPSPPGSLVVGTQFTLQPPREISIYTDLISSIKQPVSSNLLLSLYGGAHFSLLGNYLNLTFGLGASFSCADSLGLSQFYNQLELGTFTALSSIVAGYRYVGIKFQAQLYMYNLYSKIPSKQLINIANLFLGLNIKCTKFISCSLGVAKNIYPKSILDDMGFFQGLKSVDITEKFFVQFILKVER